MKVLLIIPAYNESECIVRTVTDIIENTDYDYIVVNDGSTDNTLDLLKEHGFSHLALPINLGIGGAVQAGYKYAYENGYDIAIQVDGDGQHSFADIKSLVDAIEQGANFVIGSRFIKHDGFQSSASRRLGITLLSLTIKIASGKRLYDVISGFRAADKSIIAMFAHSYPLDYPEPETNALVAKNGYRIDEVAVTMKERQGGVSSIDLSKSLYYMIKLFFAILLTKKEKKK